MVSKNGLQDISSLTLPNLDEAYQSLTPKIKTLLTNLVSAKPKDKKTKKGKEQAVLVEEKAETKEEAGENT